jgi:transketolase C-terminal domain/subunit
MTHHMVESHFHLEGVTIMPVLPNTNIMTIAV